MAICIESLAANTQFPKPGLDVLLGGLAHLC